MSGSNAASEFGLDLLPIDVRVATFLAGIQADTQNTTQSNTIQGLVPSESLDCPERNSGELEVVELGTSRETVKRARTHLHSTNSVPTTTGSIVSTRATKSSGVRKQRYRDDRQKLSNSLAQKRYRERKKRAFDELKELVDCMTIELQQLRLVKQENERLTIALEEYKQVAIMHDACAREKAPINEETKGTSAVLSASSVPSSPTSNQDSKAQTIEFCAASFGSMPQPFMHDIEDTGPMGVLRQLCSPTDASQLETCATLSARADFLETEWEGRMSAVEQFVKFQQSCDIKTLGMKSNELQSVTNECMTNLFSLSSDLASLKLLRVSEHIQSNSNRIRKAFAEFIDETKTK